MDAVDECLLNGHISFAEYLLDRNHEDIEDWVNSSLNISELYRKGLCLLQSGNPSDAAAVFYRALSVSLSTVGASKPVLHESPYLWSRLAECCMASEQASSNSESSQQEFIPVIRQTITSSSGFQKSWLANANADAGTSSMSSSPSSSIPSSSSSSSSSTDPSSPDIPNSSFLCNYRTAAICLQNALFLLSREPLTSADAPSPSSSSSTLPSQQQHQQQHRDVMFEAALCLQLSFVYMMMKEFQRAAEYADRVLTITEHLSVMSSSVSSSLEALQSSSASASASASAPLRECYQLRFRACMQMVEALLHHGELDRAAAALRLALRESEHPLVANIMSSSISISDVCSFTSATPSSWFGDVRGAGIVNMDDYRVLAFLVNQGSLQCYRGRLDEARLLFTRALMTSPSSSASSSSRSSDFRPALMGLLYVYMRTGETQAALDLLRFDRKKTMAMTMTMTTSASAPSTSSS